MAVNNKKRGKNLMKIRDFKSEVIYDDILKDFGKDTVDLLRSPGVSPHSDRPNRKTPYRLGWTWEDHVYQHGERVTVWNETNWQLTHLLENGHFITNRRGGIAWSEPKPHIKPTYNRMRPKFVKAMRKSKIETKLT